VAAEFFVRRCGEEQVHHRVSVHFCTVLRADMEQHACGGGMSTPLRREIGSYQLCMLDDTVVEAVHRDLSWQARHTVSSTISWWASSVRLKQNLALEAGPLGSLIHDTGTSGQCC
jgi:hypothetical protein